MILFSGNSNLDLAKKIAKEIGVKLGDALVDKFPEGEIRVKINDNVRGKDVFVIQSTCPPVNDNLMELLIIIDALRRASAKRITAVIPFFGYARQDRKDQPRVPITAKLVANLLTEAGADRILTMDLHAGQIQGFFDIPVDHLLAAPVFISYFKKKKIKNLAIATADIGG
ncbi:MAG: ribose-phosphate diphosphokinase, partial [Candidatus Goldbacteria bacterium]|nr:ribose-phosphate diphosphokinase [Candidatus Goldiibacteriota bacterium]